MNSNSTERATGIEPMVVSPAQAGRMGGWGKTKVFALIAGGELESFLDGSRRRITVKSVRARIRRKLEESKQQAA